jgi:hypothetical protein
MNVLTVEVELDHGRVTPKGLAQLPEKTTGWFTFVQPKAAPLSPFETDPQLPPITYYEDPTAPLDPEDWPEAFE